MGIKAASTLLFLHNATAAAWRLAPMMQAGRSVIEFGQTEANDALSEIRAAISELDSYVLAGLGTGATIAAELARRAEDGEAGFEGLHAVILLGASLGCEAGVSRRVGVLRTPALLVGARDDQARGLDHQSSLVAPHFARARLRMVASLTPPVVAELLRGEPDEAIGIASVPTEPAIDDAYAALIASDRVTARTRAALLGRAGRLAPSPVTLTPPLLGILRAAMALILPVTHAFPDDAGSTEVDIARRIDQALAGGGDGWRYAALPPDAIAAELGLRTLDDAARATSGHPFLRLDTAAQQELLNQAEQGALAGMLDASAMALWFGELKREAVRQWMSHPATLGRLGYSGIAGVRRDGPPAERLVPQGFARLGPDCTEGWEPRRC